MLIDTATPLEFLWTVVASVDFVLVLAALRDAAQDRAYVRRTHGNETRAIVAEGNVRRERNRLFVQGVFVAIGVIAMAQPPAGTSGYDTALAGAVAIGFIAASTVLVASAVQDRVERKRLIAHIARAERIGIE